MEVTDEGVYFDVMVYGAEVDETESERDAAEVLHAEVAADAFRTALSDALAAHTTVVGLAVVGMFVAALVLSMAAPTLHRLARQMCCCGKTRRRPYAEIST